MFRKSHKTAPRNSEQNFISDAKTEVVTFIPPSAPGELSYIFTDSRSLSSLISTQLVRKSWNLYSVKCKLGHNGHWGSSKVIYFRPNRTRMWLSFNVLLYSRSYLASWSHFFRNRDHRSIGDRVVLLEVGVDIQLTTKLMKQPPNARTYMSRLYFSLGGLGFWGFWDVFCSEQCLR